MDKFETNIYTDFYDLEDALNCCVASSNIPFITGNLFNKYKLKLLRYFKDEFNVFTADLNQIQFWMSHWRLLSAVIAIKQFHDFQSFVEQQQSTARQ